MSFAFDKAKDNNGGVFIVLLGIRVGINVYIINCMALKVLCLWWC